MSFLGTLGRLILVPVAALIAAAASVIVLLTLGSERLLEFNRGGGEGDLHSLTALIALAFDVHLLFSGLTLVPAVLLLIVGEVARIRSALYYTIGGGIALVAIPVMAKIGTGAALQLPPTVVWQVFATAGFAGGFLYWLVAGRSA